MICWAHLPRRKREGFTFVEVLAALVFLGVLMPVVLSALMVANRTSLTAERSAVAVQLGENRLNELMLNDEWKSAGTRGEFGEEWPGYRWELSQRDWSAGIMVELTMHVLFQVQGQERETVVSTLVSQETSP